ncbi:MAG: hypothetical protein ACK5CE_04270 [Actinomycetes bacterium]
MIEQGPYAPRGGLLGVPDGPGLGVTIDRAALARLHERFLHEGGMAADGDDAAYRGGFRQQ